MVNSVGADAIFITGDYTDTDEGLPFAGPVIAQLESKYGMWGVLGNWDSGKSVKVCEQADHRCKRRRTIWYNMAHRQLDLFVQFVPRLARFVRFVFH